MQTRAAPVKDVSCDRPTAVAPVCRRATRPVPVATLADDERTPSVSITGAQTDAESNATYWLRKREGWFWYRDPPEPPRPPKESASPPSRSPQLTRFEAMQKRLDDLSALQ